MIHAFYCQLDCFVIIVMYVLSLSSVALSLSPSLSLSLFYNSISINASHGDTRPLLSTGLQMFLEKRVDWRMASSRVVD